MHINVTLRLNPTSFQKLEEIYRLMMLAIVRFETKNHCLDSKPWSLTIIDQANHKLFWSLDENDRVIWVSERDENVPQKVIVSTAEDVFERTYEALEQIFKQ
jgi:hypothetical protein